ncbi:ThiJ/PfpI family protein [Auriculariales sp. MPI-PUGE-AT-0066]|nr:ThiJ/PfpI family protein [Auriculariales sp. MPI-PUGE-AT-0066]
MLPAQKKVLIILSDASSFELRKPDGTTVDEESGFFLSELARPLARIIDSGYTVCFASPNGGKPNVDPLSKSTVMAFLGAWWIQRREEELIQKMELENNLLHPRPFASIFWGLGRILNHFHTLEKPTASLCHGPYAFLSTQPFAYKGYKLISWSDTEEGLVETLKGGEITKVQSSLANAGAVMIDTLAAKAGSINVDREVVTGEPELLDKVLLPA